MKLKYLYLIIFATLTTFMFSTCRDKEIEAIGITLNETTFSLNIGDTVKLIACIQPSNAANQSVSWTSSSNEIATVSEGLVIAKTAGTVIITATTENSNHSASCSISVSFPLLRIVQLCDPQLGFGSFSSDVANLEKAVAQINDLEPDMVLIAGDMVHEPINEQAVSIFLDIITQIKSPILLTPGNHDMCDTPYDYFSMDGLERYHKFYGNDYSKIECKGYCIISANSHLWWTEAPQELVKLHDNWLIDALHNAKNNKQPVIFLTHIPLFVSTFDENDEYSNIPKTKRNELLTLCEENGVILWLAGHTHTTFRHELRGITFLNGETTSRHFDDRPLGFRLLTLFSDKNFEWEFFPIK